MNILNVGAFLFALSIPAVILLYFLKLKRKEKVVPSTLLWNQLIRDTRANAPFQRLKRNLLLLFQILILALLVLALARPFFPAKVPQGKNIILILDCSASMQSTDVSPSRFALARKEAVRMARSMREGDRMMVIACSSRTEARQSFSGNKDEIVRAIKSLEAKDTSANLGEGISLAYSLVKEKEENDIYILTDGAFGEIKDVDMPTETNLTDAGPRAVTKPEAEKARIHFLKFGERAHNLAITALDVRKAIASEFDHEIFISLRNFSDEESVADLELFIDGRLADVRSLSFSPGEEKSQVFESFGLTSGIIKAQLKVKDDLGVDNTAWTIVEKSPEISILVVSEGNPFLERVVNLDPRTEVSKISPKHYPPPQQYDITIIENFTPEEPPPGDCLLINCPLLLKVKAKLKRPTIIDWDRTHPVMRFVDLSDVKIDEALGFEVPKWADSLVESEKASMVVAGEYEDHRVVLIGFDTLKSTWPLKVAFPIFFSNAIKWLSPRAGGSIASQGRTGEVMRIYLEEDSKEVEVTDPEGKKTKVEIPHGPLMYKDTEKAGLYKIKGKEEERMFCVNLLNPAESNTRPFSRIAMGRKEVVEAGGVRMMNKEIWWGFVLFAFLVLLLEWWAFHKRAFI